MMNIKITVFCDVTLCAYVTMFQKNLLPLSSRCNIDPEKGSTKFFRNVGMHIPKNTVSHTTKKYTTVRKIQYLLSHTVLV